MMIMIMKMMMMITIMIITSKKIPKLGKPVIGDDDQPPAFMIKTGMINDGYGNISNRIYNSNSDNNDDSNSNSNSNSNTSLQVTSILNQHIFSIKNLMINPSSIEY